MSERKGFSLLVANNKGGVGKSTLSVTLATGLKMRGFSVLLIDADPQQSVGKWRMAAEGEAHEGELPWVERVDSPLVGEKIKMERANYDFIITDSGSNIGFAGDVAQKIILGALKSADLVVVPIGPSPLDVDGSEDMFGLLRDIWERRDVQEPPAHVVINGVKPGTSLGREVGEYVKQTYEVPVFKTQISQREAYKSCFFKGATIFHMGDKKLAADANNLLDEILEVVEGVKAK